MLKYSKPHLTLAQQIDLLKSRNLEISNNVAALEYLRRLGYYRLSGYLYPFRKFLQGGERNKIEMREDSFIAGAKFQHAVELYVFDKKLRLLVLDALERIEVAIRVDIAYLLGEKNPFAHINPDLLHGNFTKKIDTRTNQTEHQNWLDKYNQLVIRSKEDFIQHYQSKYELPLPIWISIELWDFGLMSKFYQGMCINDKNNIAAKYDIPKWELMQSWLRCLNYVRNIVAHHSRLWNKNLVDQPKLPKKGEMVVFDSIIEDTLVRSRVYIVLCILIHLMRYICPRSSWKNRLHTLIDEFPKIASVSIKDMGFPTNWKEQEIWKN